MKKLIGLALLVAAGCGGAQQSVASGASSLQSVADVQKKITDNCPADKVGKLPTDTPEKQADFSDMIGKVLNGLMSKVDFVSQLTAKNPGSDAAVKCAADQIPEPPASAPATAPAK
jgi:hypothetical protein